MFPKSKISVAELRRIWSDLRDAGRAEQKVPEKLEMPLEPDRRPESCIVVGAGMAGLMAARMLTSAGVRVLVVDKGRGVGGRMATRRAPGLRAGRAGIWDHGAQFFTAREEGFQALVSGWLNQGVAEVWGDAFPGDSATDASSTHPRYRGTSGMAGIAKFLARGLEVHLSARVVAVRLRDRRWQLETEAGNRHVADALVLTPPVPQSLSLLDAGGVRLQDGLRVGLEGIAYAPCIAVLACLEGRSAVPEPGGIATGPDHRSCGGTSVRVGYSAALEKGGLRFPRTA